MNEIEALLDVEDYLKAALNALNDIEDDEAHADIYHEIVDVLNEVKERLESLS